MSALVCRRSPFFLAAFEFTGANIFPHGKSRVVIFTRALLHARLVKESLTPPFRFFMVAWMSHSSSFVLLVLLPPRLLSTDDLDLLSRPFFRVSETLTFS